MGKILFFESFISPYILIALYYIGAILIPVMLYWYRKQWLDALWPIKYKKVRLYHLLKTIAFKKQVYVWLAVLGIFLCMELCWRMIFEVMIGYFDMHDYLQQIANSTRQYP